jgi:UDP-N-acetylmuramoyl-tripeptide--D-alanyl-D-alanine ligase
MNAIEKIDLERIGRLEGTANSFHPISEPKASIDSRTTAKGDLFFALIGEQTDGHHFIDAAFEKGASLAVVSEAWFDSIPKLFLDHLYVVVPDTLKAMQSLATIYRNKFSIPIIAIGGNSGKTTTKEMMAAVLSSSYKTLATKGNLNNHIGVPLTLFGLRDETEIAVIETGMNHYGEMTTLCEIAEPTHGLITNIGKAHIEFFGNIENVAKSEAELYDWLAKSGGSIFVNADDSLVLAKSTVAEKKFFYGTKSGDVELNVSAEETGLTEKGCSIFKLKSKGNEVTVKLKISGRHNVQNALAAAAVGLNFGIDIKKIKASLENFEINPALKRMHVSEVEGVTLINDSYNANPESMRAALKTLADMKVGGKKIAVLGDMLELGELAREEHQLLGIFIRGLELDALYTHGKMMKETNKLAEAKRKVSYESKAEILKSLVASIGAGDAILFKGSRGMKMEEVYEEVKKHLIENKD